MWLYLYFLLEDDYTSTLVSCGQQLACVVKLNRGYDVRCKKRRRHLTNKTTMAT